MGHPTFNPSLPPGALQGAGLLPLQHVVAAKEQMGSGEKQPTQLQPYGGRGQGGRYLPLTGSLGHTQPFGPRRPMSPTRWRDLQPRARLPKQGHPPGSDVVVLTIPAPVCVGEAIYPQVVNGAQGKHPPKVAVVG